MVARLASAPHFRHLGMRLMLKRNRLVYLHQLIKHNHRRNIIQRLRGRDDICGESARVPRHARVYGDVASLKRRIAEERVKALAAFRDDVVNGSFPDDSEVGRIDPSELARFVESFDGV